MAIPPFEPSGLLPPGVHAATTHEVEASLVQAIPGSSTRQQLYAWWTTHREALAHLINCNRQWIGGSFATTKTDPSDVDVCTHIDGPALDALPLGQHQLVRFMTSGKVAEAHWHCDSYLITEYPPGSPFHAAYLASLAYWQDFWAHTRPDVHGVRHPRGYVEVSGPAGAHANP